MLYCLQIDATLYCTVLYCIVLYCIVSYGMVWYGMVLYCIALCCIDYKWPSPPEMSQSLAPDEPSLARRDEPEPRASRTRQARSPRRSICRAVALRLLPGRVEI